MEFLHLTAAVWRESMVGGLVVVVCVTMGYRLGDHRASFAVRMVVWWMNRVVRPLLRAQSWFTRLAIISGNNMTLCGLVVLIGALGQVAWLGVAGLGLGLGMSLRLMAGPPATERFEDRPEHTDIQVRMTQIGLFLNLLEIPAIMLATGLCLAQGALSDRVGFVQAITTYAVVVLPLLLVSAAGEALWMTLNPEMLHAEVPGEEEE